MDLQISERINIQQEIGDGMERATSKTDRRRETIELWQQRWSNTQKGRSTWAYCEDVGVRYACDWEIHQYVTQYLTDHGNLKSKLYGFGQVGISNCAYCDVIETMEHVLWKCWKYNDRRQDFYNELEDDNPREHLLEVMADTTKRRRLFRHMKDIGREKEAHENELENGQD